MREDVAQSPSRIPAVGAKNNRLGYVFMLAEAAAQALEETRGRRPARAAAEGYVAPGAEDPRNGRRGAAESGITENLRSASKASWSARGPVVGDQARSNRPIPSTGVALSKTSSMIARARTFLLPRRAVAVLDGRPAWRRWRRIDSA